MFYRYVSENLTAYINDGETAAGNTDFDYAKMSDADVEEAREGLVEEKGFFILPSELFCNVVKKADKDENLNVNLANIFYQKLEIFLDFAQIDKNSAKKNAKKA